MSTSHIYVAWHPCFGAPVFQEHMHLFGIVVTRCPFAGQVESRMTDDFGNLVSIQPAGWIATVQN